MKNSDLLVLGIFTIFVVVFAFYAINANKIEEICRAKAKQESVTQAKQQSPEEQNTTVLSKSAYNIEYKLLINCFKENKLY